MMDSDFSLVVGSFSKNDDTYQKSKTHYDRIRHLFGYNGTKCKSEFCKSVSVFAEHCLNCLDYQVYTIACGKIVNSLSVLDERFLLNVTLESIDTELDVVNAIKNKVYNELIKAVKSGRSKAVYCWIGVPFYILLHFKNDNIVPESLCSILLLTPGDFDYSLYWRVLNVSTLSLRFQFSLRINGHVFLSEVYVTTPSQDKLYVDGYPMNDENTYVFPRSASAPSRFYLERWCDDLKMFIFTDIVKKVCSLKVNKIDEKQESMLGEFIKRCRYLSMIKNDDDDYLNNSIYSVYDPRTHNTLDKTYFQCTQYKKVWGKKYFSYYSKYQYIDRMKTNDREHFVLLLKLELFFDRYFTTNKTKCSVCSSVLITHIYGMCSKCSSKRINMYKRKIREDYKNVIGFIERTTYDSVFIKIVQDVIKELKDRNKNHHTLEHRFIEKQIDVVKSVLAHYSYHHGKFTLQELSYLESFSKDCFSWSWSDYIASDIVNRSGSPGFFETGLSLGEDEAKMLVSRDVKLVKYGYSYDLLCSLNDTIFVVDVIEETEMNNKRKRVFALKKHDASEMKIKYYIVVVRSENSFSDVQKQLSVINKTLTG